MVSSSAGLFPSRRSFAGGGSVRGMAEKVASRGRYGDSELVHMNPVELEGIASVMPITKNPETGQPEMFLPLLLGALGGWAGGAAGGAALGGVLGGTLAGALGTGVGAMLGHAGGQALQGEEVDWGHSALMGVAGAGIGALSNMGSEAAVAELGKTTSAVTPVANIPPPSYSPLMGHPTFNTPLPSSYTTPPPGLTVAQNKAISAGIPKAQVLGQKPVIGFGNQRAMMNAADLQKGLGGAVNKYLTPAPVGIGAIALNAALHDQSSEPSPVRTRGTGYPSTPEHLKSGFQLKDELYPVGTGVRGFI